MCEFDIHFLKFQLKINCVGLPRITLSMSDKGGQCRTFQIV